MARPGYIFIVGLGRTGSTLTRSILNSSPEIGIGGESHFLRDLPRLGFQSRSSMQQRLRRIGDISTEQGARKVVDYLYAVRQRHLNFWNFQARQFDRQEFLSQLLESDRSERAFFDLAMAFHAQGKPVRGEKTPAHIYLVPTLLEWFPDAKIIHTFRDPRAIYMSRKKKSEKKALPGFNRSLRRFGLVFELISSFHVILNWLRVTRLHAAYQERYPDCYILSKYEDLVRDPAGCLQQLCAFLGVDYREEMLAQSVVNSSYQADGSVGFEVAAIERWREHMDPLLNRWFLFWCRKDLVRMGYSPEAQS